MRRKYMADGMMMILAATLLAGCAKTPESSIVKQKGQSAMENYQETSETAAGEAVVEPENIQDNPLRTRLEAPAHYQSEVTDTTGKLKVYTDAEVEIPNADKVSSVAVKQMTFDQAMIDRITETFFADADIYDAEPLWTRTRSEVQEQIEELKGYLAEGNLDPYNFGTDENGNVVYDLNEAIEAAEQELLTAPEEHEKKLAHPQLGVEEDLEGNQVKTNFYGYVETKDGAFYDYTIKSYASMPMNVKIERKASLQDFLNQDGTRTFWSEYESLKSSYGDQLPKEDELKQNMGITLEEAKAIADEKVQALGLEHMELTNWEYGVQYKENNDIKSELDVGYSAERQTNTGYILYYTRHLNNIPVIYTMEYGGGLESMESDMETWCYERLEFYVTKDGIDKVEMMNFYDIGETKTENLELLPFAEIMQIYEKMMQIQNADAINYDSERIYEIDRIALGYTRIYEPASDTYAGLLVPAWQFFGGFRGTTNMGGEAYDFENREKYQSYLTVNAVDGSIINQSLGY